MPRPFRFVSRLACCLGVLLTPAMARGEETRAKEPGTHQECSEPSSEQALSSFLQTKGKALEGVALEKALRKDYAIKCMVALLPDPVLSRLGYRFDLALESIERALERERYVLDRWWLPWPIVVGGPAKSPWDEDDGGKPRESNASKPHPADTQPGLLLFRRVPRPAEVPPEGKQGRLLALYVVGELPTAGAHKVALSRALTRAAALDEDHQVRLLGPSFTGTQPSLSMVLDQWLGGRKEQVNIICGGATGIDGTLFMKRLKHRDKVNFQRTVHSDAVASDCLRDYLVEKRGARAKQIVWLVETNTSFGRISRAIDPNDTRHEPRVLPFPLHVSQVRNVYNRHRLARDESLPRIPSQVSYLRLPFEDPGDARDIVPPLTGAMTASAVELLLARILSTISREEVRYVGIVATDTRDKVFLASMIQDYAPDVQLFTTTSDTLLAHPNYYRFTRGMLVASTYPLYSRNQDWSPPLLRRPRRFEFSHQSHQGLFNAALALLDTGKQPDPNRRPWMRMLEYGHPFATEENGEDRSNPYPPIWISAVGRQGLLPVDVKAVKAEDAVSMFSRPRHEQPPEDTEDRRDPLRPDAPWGWWILFSLVCGSSILLATLLLFDVGRDTGFPFEEFHPVRPDTTGLGRWQAVWLALLFLTLAGLLVCTFWLNWWAGRKTIWTSVLLILNSVAGGASVAAAAFAVLRWKFPTWVGQDVLVRIGIGAMAILAFAVCCWWTKTNDVISLSNIWHLFQFERTVHVTSGLSYIVPIGFLAAAWCLWCFARLRAIAVLDRHWVPWPYPSLKSSRERFHSANEDLMRTLDCHSLGSSWPWSLFFLGVVCFTAWFFLTLPWTTEGPLVDLALRAGMLVVSLSLLAGLTQFAMIWRRLARLLNLLVRLPIVSAYTRLPRPIATLFGRTLTARRSRYGRLQIERHQLGLLARLEGVTLPEVDAVKATALEVDGLFDQDKLDENSADKQIATAASQCVAILTQYWSALPASYSFGPPTQDHKGDEPVGYPGGQAGLGDRDCEWLQLAEDLVATRTVAYVGQFFVQLRNLAAYLTAGSVLLLLAVSNYPGQPYRLLQLVTWLPVVGIVVAILAYLVQMERNEFVSYASGTRPNQITWDQVFLGNVFAYLVPITALIALQIPWVGDYFRSLVEPVLRVLK